MNKPGERKKVKRSVNDTTEKKRRYALSEVKERKGQAPFIDL